jgi:hypothetical protein
MPNPTSVRTQGTLNEEQSTPSNTKAPTAETLKGDVGGVVEEAKAVANKVGQEAGTQFSQLSEQAKSKVAETAEHAKGIAAHQKDLLAEQIGGVADAMQRVATDLEAGGGASATYARMIADNAEQLSATVRDNSVDQIMIKAQNFGRQQPAAFLGAAALLGFAASRFLLASANRAETAQPSAASAASTATPGYGRS